MKIIFLDIDGVFNSMNFFKNNQIINKNESSEERIKRNINISKVEMFSNLLKKHPSYEVCLSSSWRIGWNKGVSLELKKLLELYNIFIKYFTPSINSPCDANNPDKICSRGLEIKTWLEDNKNLNIENWCAIDDDWIDMKWIIELNKFVQTGFKKMV